MRKRGGGIRGGCYTRGLRGKRRGGERRVGRRRREEKEFMHFKSRFSSLFFDDL